VHRVADALVGDETGCVVLTLWDDNIDKVNEEATLQITNGYVNLFRGNMRLNIGRYGSFQILEETPITEVTQKTTCPKNDTNKKDATDLTDPDTAKEETTNEEEDTKLV